MTFKLTLATTTAVALLMSAAFAGSENEVYIDQIGSGNSASIVQGQSDGSAVGNRAGYETTRMRQDGTDNQLIINQTGNSQLVYTATQTNNGSNGGANVASVTQGGGNGNQIRELTQTNTGASDNIASLTFSGSGNGVTSGVFTGPALGVGVSQSRVRQTGEGNDLTFNVTGNDNLFGFAQDGWANLIIGTVDGNANQVAIAQTGEGNEALASTNGNTNQLGLSQIGLANFGEVQIGSRDAASDNNSVALNQDSVDSVGNVGEIYIDGAGNAVSLEQVGLIGSNYGVVDVFGYENNVTFEQVGSNEGEVSVAGYLNVVSLNQNGSFPYGNYAGVLVDGYENTVSLDQLGATGSNDAIVDIRGDANEVSVDQNGSNEGSVYVAGNGNAATLDQEGNFNSAMIDTFGASNQINVDQSGDFNDAWVQAYGNANNVTLNQAGDVNFGELYLDGHANTISVDQDGSGGENSLTAEVTGSSNI